LPAELKVRGLANGQKLHVTVWEDVKPNRLLFFSEAGRLVGRGQLAQTDPLTLPPGGYVVLARFVPGDVQADEISDEPRLVSFPLLLEPGDKHVLSNGPARLAIHAECVPLIRWMGEVHTSKEGVEFRHGEMTLEVILPKDWLGQAATYELTLNPGERGESRVVSLKLDAKGKASFSVSELAAQAGWKSGLMRLVAELRRSGEARILLRMATLFWLGLDKISRGLRFHCAAWPDNLKLEFGENLERSGDDLVVKEVAARSVRLVFALSEKRQQSLTWNVPGLFVEVETVAESGASVRSRRAMGSTETVSLTSAKQILVIASDPGTLRLGDWSLRVDFSRHATKLLGAAFLASRLTPLSNSLVYENEITGTSLEVLRLTQPHDVKSFGAKVQSGQFVIHLHVNEAVDAVAVRVKALHADDNDHFTLSATLDEWTCSRFGRAKLMVPHTDAGGYAAYVYLDLDYWPAGAWLFDLDAQIKGVWGHLQNSRQDVYTAGLLWAGGGQALTPRAWLEEVEALDDRAALALLHRLHAAIQLCYALEAWNGIAWLADAWKVLAKRWRGREAEALPSLADMVAMRPPKDSSPSWLPQLSIAATLPGMFSLAAEEYRCVDEKPQALPRAMRAMAEMTSRWPTVFPDLLHFSAAAACANFPAIASRGAAPQGVNPQRYIEAMQSVPYEEYQYPLSDDEILPGPGSYLGPLHYRHAWRALEMAYERTLQGNDVWRGQGIGLAQHACKVMPKLDGWGIPPAWHGQSPHINAWTANPDAVEDDAVLQQRENLDHIIAHLLASLALMPHAMCARHAKSLPRPARPIRDSTRRPAGFPDTGRRRLVCLLPIAVGIRAQGRLKGRNA
jgi:hypothetical protein